MTLADDLNGRRVAVLVANEGVEQIEMTTPVEALREAGAEVDLVAPEDDEIQAFNHLDKADTFKPDRTLGDADPSDYDGLLLPGGVANPDALRMQEEAISFVRSFFDEGKPVAAICHAPWTLVEADVVRGRTLTSWPSLRTDIRNAGGNWVDEEVRVDEGLVTSRKPDDLDAFCAKAIEEFAEGVHEGQRPEAVSSRG
jgi:protease I